MSAARWASQLWGAFWFVPDTARNLAAARVIVGLHALWHLLSRDYAAVAGYPGLWAAAPASQRWRYLIFDVPVQLEYALQWLAVIALVAVILGVHARAACLVAAVLLYHLAPLETVFWGMQQPTGRGMTLAAPMLVILGCTRCADAFRLLPRASAPQRPSWEYGWPRKLLWLLVAEIFLFAFYGKMTMTGPTWAAADNIRQWLLAFNLGDRWRFGELGLWIAEHPLLCLGMGVGALVFQAAFVGALFSRRARYVLLPMALVFSLGTVLTLNIHVGEEWLALLFINWDWVLRRGRRSDVARAVT